MKKNEDNHLQKWLEENKDSVLKFHEQIVL